MIACRCQLPKPNLRLKLSMKYSSFGVQTLSRNTEQKNREKYIILDRKIYVIFRNHYNYISLVAFEMYRLYVEACKLTLSQPH